MRLSAAVLFIVLLAASADAAPEHVPTWLYYGLDGVNTSISAGYMARHATFVESDVDESDRGEAFKAAGGKYAAAYTNPGFVPYCQPPFEVRPGHCTGPIGNLDPPESAWLHDENGSRIHHFVDAHAQYQEALNPAAPAAQQAFRNYTAAVRKRAPHLDYIFADDSGGEYRGVDGTAKTGAFWNFNTLPREIRDDRTFAAGREAMFRASELPVFVNGLGPQHQPSYGGAFMRAPNVAGLIHEGCFNDDDRGHAADFDDRFRQIGDSLLENTRAERYAVCMFEGKATPADRVFDLASWWLTYDERWSVAAPVSAPPDGFTVLPEFEIVPTQPRQTPRSVADLRTSGGVYVREFAACHLHGAALGPCAAAVNAQKSVQHLPSSLVRYRRVLALDDRSLYRGGRATWRTEIPSDLPPLSAAIVAR